MAKILITGLYDPNYPRNQQVVGVFRKLGEVSEWPFKSRWWGGLKLALYLVGSYQYKYVVVMQPAHFILPFLSLIKYAPGRPRIIVDAFISIYDTNIADRGLAHQNSFKAKFYRWLDSLVEDVADGVFFDTLEHQAYFNLPSDLPQAIIPVVPDSDLLNSIQPDKDLLKPDKINVLFYGKYIPLQGVKTIIEAAKLLEGEEGLHFTLIGGGQDYSAVRVLAKELAVKNVTFHSRVPYVDIIAALKASDLALGVFGNSEKMQRVVPNKVIEALVAGTPLITGESKAVERYFKNNEHLFLVPPAHPQALAQKIKEVTADLSRAKQIALAGQVKAKQDFNEKLVEERLSELLAKVE